MPSSMVLTLLVFGALFVGLALLAPAGWGLPSPALALLALLAAAPAVVVGWMLYRRALRRGDIPPPGREAREGRGEVPREAQRTGRRSSSPPGWTGTS